MARDKIGPFEADLLTVLIRRPQGSYGASIARDYNEIFGRDPSVGGIYVVLDRLETKGLVTSAWGEPTGVRGGRRQRQFTITAAGRAAMASLNEANARRSAAAQPFGAPVPEGA